VSVQYDKKRKRYYVRYKDDNGRHRKESYPGTETGKQEAKARDHEIKHKKALGEELPGSGPDGIHLDELAQLWIDAKLAEGRAPRWIKEWASVLQKHILPHLARQPIPDLTYQQIVTFIAQEYPELAQKSRRGARRPGRNTINRYTRYLKSMFNFGVDHGYLESNPLRRWKTPKEPPAQTMLTVPDLRKIIKHAAPHLRWAMEVEFNLGVRAGTSELLGLQWQMIDWDAWVDKNGQTWGVIRVYAPKTKRWRRIPIHPAFLARLKQQKEQSSCQHLIEYRGGPIKKLRNSVKTACKKAGLPYHIRMTDIRHLFATCMLQGGADLKAVSELMGHSSTKMTADQYYFLLKEEKQRAMATLPPLIDDVATNVATFPPKDPNNPATRKNNINNIK
jgi:integrase